REAPRLLSDPEEWRRLLESARAAWKRADRLAEGDRDVLPPDLRKRLTPLAEQLQADESDRQSALALDKIRLESSNLVAGRFELWSSGPKLAKVFQDAGYDLERESPIDLAARIHESLIRLPLVAALDFWAT